MIWSNVKLELRVIRVLPDYSSPNLKATEGISDVNKTGQELDPCGTPYCRKVDDPVIPDALCSVM